MKLLKKPKKENEKKSGEERLAELEKEIAKECAKCPFGPLGNCQFECDDDGPY